jgi:hypothetical protein
VDVVGAEGSISRNDDRIEPGRLGDEHAVERIPVMTGQCAGRHGVGDRDRKG